MQTPSRWLSPFLGRYFLPPRIVILFPAWYTFFCLPTVLPRRCQGELKDRALKGDGKAEPDCTLALFYARSQPVGHRAFHRGAVAHCLEMLARECNLAFISAHRHGLAGSVSQDLPPAGNRDRGRRLGSGAWFEFVITKIRGCDGPWIKRESIDCFDRNSREEETVPGSEWRSYP